MRAIWLGLAVVMIAALSSSNSRAESDFVELCACDAGCGSGVGCGDACGSGSLFSSWLGADPFKLPQPGVLQDMGIHVGGWLQAGITTNSENPADGYNGPLLTNDVEGEVQMNQLWFNLHRPVDTSDGGFDIGGRVDFFYGTDWRVAYLHGFGLEGDLNGAILNSSNQLYGVSLPQFYTEVAYNDLSVKIGRMTGILGYEIVPPMGNFFYSHSYALAYGEPILITGAMSSFQLNPQMNIKAGIHQGIHQFADNNGNMSFQGGLFWHSEDDRFSLAYAMDYGKNDFIFPIDDEYVQSVVAKYQVSPDLLYVFQNDIGHGEGAAGSPDVEWYGINQHLLYSINKVFSAGIRYEWFRDDDGTRILGLGNLDAQGWSPPSGTPGFAGSFHQVTMGVNVKPKSNLTLRPEVRWDWYDGTLNGAGLLPFGAGTSSDQFTFATDVMLTF